MNNVLRNAVQQRRQFLIDKLIKIGVFKKEDRHLYEWTISDLEREYQYLESHHVRAKINQENQLQQ